MTSIESILKRLSEEGALQERLHAAMGASTAGASAVIYLDGRRHAAARGDCAAATPVEVGCIAKSLTATLVAIAEHEGRLQLVDSVARCLPCEDMGSVHLYHLLNHTSGLDQSLLETVPLSREGCVDVEGVCRNLGKPLSRPGEFFSYSNVGSWLVAAVLEDVWGATYEQVLDRELLRPLGIERTARAHARVCPGMGGEGLCLSAEDLMSFCVFHLEGDRSRPGLAEHLLRLRTEFSAPLPVWPSSGERLVPGWFDFGSSLGHLGHGERGSAALRIFPAANAAVVVTATHPRAATAVFSRLLSGAIEDWGTYRLPEMLDGASWADMDHSMYTGTFRNAKYRLVIDTATNGQLRGRVFRSAADEEVYVKRYFRAAAGDLFIPVLPEQHVLPRLQFARRGMQEPHQYVDTGRYAFARCAAAIV